MNKQKTNLRTNQPAFLIDSLLARPVLNQQPARPGKHHRTVQHNLQWFFLCLLMALGWVGCKQDAKVADDINPTGTYALVTINGNTLPYTIKSEGGVIAKSGSFTINADGTCSSKIILSRPAGDDATMEVKATYTLKGSTLTMKWQGAGTTTGTIEENKFSMVNEGVTFAYRK